MSASIDGTRLLLLVLVFAGAVLLLQGGWLVWSDRRRTVRSRQARWAGFAPQAPGTADAPPVSTAVSQRRRSPAASSGLQGALRALSPVRSLEARLRAAGSDSDPLPMLSGSMALALVCVFLALWFGVAPLPLALVAVAVMVFPWLRASMLADRRQQKLQAQLGDAVELIARALRAGHALPSALRMVADQAPAPISDEFVTVCEQIAFGVSAEEALRSLAERNRSEDLRYFVIAVLLQRETGGNLAELLDNIGVLVRQRQQLRQSVRALSAEGRLAAWILGLLPFAVAGAISFINPDLLSLLWTDPVGRVISMASLVMVAVGSLIMRALVRVRA